LIDAVAPFTAETGTAAAFVTTPKDPDINKPTIDYVATLVPKASGKDFNPHVTVGIASQDYLKKMVANRLMYSRSRQRGRPFTNSVTSGPLAKNSRRGSSSPEELV
jgi:hypothetical protein